MAETAPHTVLLVGNYPPDGQRSMRRFTGLLAEGLRAEGVRVERFHPPVVVGRLGASGRGFGKWVGYIDKYLLLPFFLRRALRRLRRAHGRVIAHICDHSNAPYTRWVADGPHLVTCHDLLAVRSALGEVPENRVRFTGRQQQAMILRGLRRSQSIVCVSGATRDDLHRLIGARPERSRVIPNVLDAAFIREAADGPEPSEAAERPPEAAGILGDAPYVMHVGGDKWYKNRDAVLALFARLAAEDERLRLAVVGPEFSGDRLDAAGAGHLASRIHYAEGVDDRGLRALYRNASLLLFPSRMEGFGWPILEAQACGCPAATLDRPPMNELNALPELRLPADVDAADWAERAARACSAATHATPARRDEMGCRARAFAARFSPGEAARQYREVYDELAARTETP